MLSPSAPYRTRRSVSCRAGGLAAVVDIVSNNTPLTVPTYITQPSHHHDRHHGRHHRETSQPDVMPRAVVIRLPSSVEFGDEADMCSVLRRYLRLNLRRVQVWGYAQATA